MPKTKKEVSKVKKWTEALKSQLIETGGKEEELIAFQEEYRPDLSLETLSRFYRKFRARGKGNTFVDFLATGKTYKEIQEQFQMTKEEVDKKLSEEVEGLELFKTRNHFQEEVFVYLPLVKKEFSISPKEWTFRKQPDGEPYLWVQIPDSLDCKKLKIVPIADAHFGAFAHDRARFDEYVSWIAKSPNVFVFLCGDLIEFTQGDTLKGVAIHEQKIRPHEQAMEMMLKLAPIAHKILWGLPGNHENRARKYDFNYLEWICDKLEVPYFDEPVYVDILWKGYVFDFFAQHGTTNSQTKGGKMNAAARPLQFQEFVMFTIYAHVHDSTTNKVVRICRDRVNFRLQLKKQYVVICPSFHKYFGTYAAKQGYAPGSLGSVACEIYKNGDYHATS